VIIDGPSQTGCVGALGSLKGAIDNSISVYPEDGAADLLHAKF
jgi:hypothetical protein